MENQVGNAWHSVMIRRKGAIHMNKIKNLSMHMDLDLRYRKRAKEIKRMSISPQTSNEIYNPNIPRKKKGKKFTEASSSPAYLS